MLAVEQTPLSWLREDGLEELMHDHWRECSIDHDEVPLNPNWELAATMERQGTLHTFALYEDKKLIGYATFEVAPHLMFKSTRYAWNTGIYVDPKHRKGNAGLKLFAEAEKMLVNQGVRKLVYSAPDTSPLHKLLQKAGYRPSERYYTKVAA
jgi:GNAT superfamily N-acetyltransferase